MNYSRLRSNLNFDVFGSNVERLACIWQDLHPGDNPDYWLDPDGHGGTDSADPTADLWPFHMDNDGHHYTSDIIRDWRPLGYTYPGLEKWLDKFKVNGHFDESTYLASIRSQMDKLYSITARAVLELPRHAAVANVYLAALSQESQRPIFSELAKSEPEKAVTKESGVPASQHPIVAAQPQEAKEAVEPQATATGHPIVGPDLSAPEKWEENDYIVNVIYEK
jgi:hypothetical protein